MREDVLERKIARIIVRLSQELNVSDEKALDIFYATETYRQLTDRKTGLCLMSDGYILDELCKDPVVMGRDGRYP